MRRGLNRILNVEDARRAARRRLPRGLFEYIDRGSEDELSIASNRARLDAVKLAPSVLVDVTQRSQAATMFGEVRSSPLIIAPTAVAGLVWHDGEVALAKAASAAGIPFCVSTQSMTSIEQIANRSGAELWLQLYVWKNRQRTLALLDRAWNAGARTLVLTVDTAVGPKREYNQRNGFGIPLKPSLRAGLDVLAHPCWATQVFLRTLLTGGVPTYAHYPDEFRTHVGRQSLSDEMALAADVSWNDVGLLRERWKGRLVLKGVLRLDDAEKAAIQGVDGIVVSNHGGRNLDAAISPVDVLPEIAKAVGTRLTVLADSGVRRGADIARYIGLGAEGVMIGRATLFGMAVAGEAGASRVLDLLREELLMTMGMLGARTLDDLHHHLVR